MTENNHKALYIFEKAASITNLIERANCNRRYASNDFDAWINSLFEGLDFSSVLDVCCGSGNQLVLYGKRPRVSLIAGVDISKEAVKTAYERLKKFRMRRRLVLKITKMEDMFEDPCLGKLTFGLISCFYGLYYSDNIGKTVAGMMDHLSGGGRLIIAGPYGKNNASLFRLLSRRFTLPDFVVKSSSTFMEEEVYPILADRCEVEKKVFVNKINYPDPAALMAYWKASTFYCSKLERKIAEDLEAHFSRNKEFSVEKHAIAYIARKRV